MEETEEATSTQLVTAASASSGSSQKAFVVVQFDDGPETGVLADVSEDDFCDPRFWRFEKVHKRKPTAKVLFPDGMVTFITERPTAPSGLLIDEDNDSHDYVFVEEPQATAAAATARRPASVRKPGSCGWGHVVLEATVDVDNSGSGATTTQRKRGRGRDDEDWAAGKRKSAAQRTSRPVKQPRRAPKEEARDQPLQDLAVPAEADQNAIAPLQDLAASEVHLQVAEPLLGTSADEIMHGIRDPQAPSAMGEQSSQEAALAEESAVPADDKLDSAKFGPVLLERAKTGRSNCRTCGQGIPRDGFRVGLQGFSNGRTITFWAHGSCFLSRVSAEYAAGRGRCRGSAEAFARGDLRVGLEVGGLRTWWLPKEAARWTVQVLQEVGEKSSSSAEGGLLTTVIGLQTLDASHQEPLLQLLRSGLEPGIELRRSGEIAGSGTPRGSSSKKTAETLGGPAANESEVGGITSEDLRDAAAEERAGGLFHPGDPQILGLRANSPPAVLMPTVLDEEDEEDVLEMEETVELPSEDFGAWDDDDLQETLMGRASSL